MLWHIYLHIYVEWCKAHQPQMANSLPIVTLRLWFISTFLKITALHMPSNSNPMMGVLHYNDVIIGTIASQITSLTIVFSTAYSDADLRKPQSFASLASVRGVPRGPVNSAHKYPVTQKMFPFDDVIMDCVGSSCDMTGTHNHTCGIC